MERSSSQSAWGLVAPALLVLLLALAQASPCWANYCKPENSCWPSDKAFAKFAKSLSPDTVALSRRSEQHYMFSRLSSPNTDENMLKQQLPGPGAIVVPASEEDIAKAVVFASRHKIRVVAKCSGHNENARASGNGVMQLQMSKLKNITFDAKDNTVTFQPGANHGEIYQFLSTLDRLYIGGQYASVCPAGCLTGGCHGPATRAYGLGADNVDSLRVVLYNGTTVTASATTHPDLFNAMLGAGQSSYGIIASITARTHPAPSEGVVWGKARFKRPMSAEDTPNALTRFFFNATWLAALPDTVGMYLESSGLAAGDNTFLLQLVYTGTDAAGEVGAILGELPDSPYLIEDTLTTQNFSNIYDYADAAYGDGVNKYTRGFHSNALLPPNQEQLDAAAATIASTPLCTAHIWYTFGGKVSTGTVGSFNKAMRSAILQVNLGYVWVHPREDESYLATLVGPTSAATLATSNASYVNEYTAYGGFDGVPLLDLADWKTRFYADYDALLQVKRAYDPCNLFTVQHGPGWDQPRATCRLKK